MINNNKWSLSRTLPIIFFALFLTACGGGGGGGGGGSCSVMCTYGDVFTGGWTDITTYPDKSREWCIAKAVQSDCSVRFNGEYLDSYRTYYRDADNDNYGNPAISQYATSRPTGWVTNKRDCNDSNAAIHPGATEIADGIDNDCNRQIDDITYYQDADSDGYGNPANSQRASSQPAGWVTNNTDCNDADATIKPNATEVVDGIDNDCDNRIDEGSVVYYQDADNDGYGDPSTPQRAYSQPAGWVLDRSDCNDANTAINPDATEVTDGIDNDCDGRIDEVTYYQDADNDEYGDPANAQEATSQPAAGWLLDNTDCNDANSNVNPAAVEIVDDGIDNNCDGQQANTYYQDGDGDGYGGSTITLVATSLPAGFVSNNNDCNDSDAAISPGAREITDSIDNNCDGRVDEKNRLNDTGITWGGNYPSGNNTTCIGETIAQQDCSNGRDAIFVNVDSDGHAGFSYTKLDTDGNDLHVSATSWFCVRDNVTGLIWEVKQGGNGVVGDEGLHDTDDIFAWYNTNPTTNGGMEGSNGSDGYDISHDPAVCYGYVANNSASYCNTQAYVARVNAASLCGATDWRLPNKMELVGLTNRNRAGPAIDVAYFPNTKHHASSRYGSGYWSSSPGVRGMDAWYINFGYGITWISSPHSSDSVRLVRR